MDGFIPVSVSAPHGTREKSATPKMCAQDQMAPALALPAPALSLPEPPEWGTPRALLKL